ncbi:hypothetical protein [Photobacterium leiognathi]|uniref:hypothetical protein n=1 Tax=Photobacterium leiognathi TaxID=553611 RepID=UPI002982077C|nr:hypothetical protein [Photobacterium leiognathi]
MSFSTILGQMSFTVPLPMAAFTMFVIGALYSIWKFRRTVKKISINQAYSVHQSYKNFILFKANGYLPSYPALDPDREMELLAKNWVVHLYSRKYAKLIYARILDCIDTHRFMLHSMKIDDKLCNSEHFNHNYMQNVQLYFFLIDILQCSNATREVEFKKFSAEPNYLYDLYDGYFKKLTTLFYQSKE